MKNYSLRGQMAPKPNDQRPAAPNQEPRIPNCSSKTTSRKTERDRMLQPEVDQGGLTTPEPIGFPESEKKRLPGSPSA